MPLDLKALAKQLGGEVTSGAVSCPGPGHSRQDRSLRVFVDYQSPVGFRVTSHAGDDWRDCQAHVCRILGIDGWKASAEASPQPARTRPVRAASAETDRSGMALSIWRASVPLCRTLGETYLSKRVGQVLEWPADLRFHEKCPRGDRKLPALIALLRDIRTDEPRAIQRIFLRDDGGDRLRDASGKMTLGPAAGTVCKLSPCPNVTNGLGICEGIEKSLALMAIGWEPIWCTVGTGGMSTFPVLAGIEALTVFADADAPGHKAATACAQRWSDRGTYARVVTPREPGTDWSDALRAAA